VKKEWDGKWGNNPSRKRKKPPRQKKEGTPFIRVTCFSLEGAPIFFLFTGGKNMAVGKKTKAPLRRGEEKSARHGKRA